MRHFLLRRLLLLFALVFLGWVGITKPKPPEVFKEQVLGVADSIENMFFHVAIPATFDDTVTFKKAISAPNLIESLRAGDGIKVTNGVIPIISNTGIIELLAGDGITVDGNKITNSGIKSLSAGDGITVDGNKITNKGILSLAAGTNISIDGNKITNTYVAPTIDYSLSGWTDTNGVVTLTTSTDTVNIPNTLTTHGIDNQGNGIINAGSITGATGITSIGTITFGALSTGILKTNASGVVSSSAVDLGDGDVTGTLGTIFGGTGITSYSIGDLVYASSSSQLKRLGIGGTGTVLTVAAGVPTWGSITGGSGICPNCLVNDPGSSQTITPTGTSTTGLIIKQASGSTVDIFKVTDNAGTTAYLTVDRDGNVQLGSGGQTTAGVLTVSPSNTDPIAISPVAKGANPFTGTISSNDLTAARTWTFPDATGIVCLTSGNCTGTSSSLGGNGTTNYLSKWSDTYSLTNSLLYDNGTSVGIGTTSPTSALHVIGTTYFAGNSETTGITRIGGAFIAGSTFEATGAATLRSSLGVIGDTTMGGTLGVTGNATFSGTLKVTGNSTFDTNTLYVDAVNHRVGIGTTSPTSRLYLVGSLSGNDSTVQYIDSTSSTQSNRQSALLIWHTGNTNSGIDVASSYNSNIVTAGIRSYKYSLQTNFADYASYYSGGQLGNAGNNKTAGEFAGYLSALPLIDSGSSLTSFYGFLVPKDTTSGTTNKYGLYIGELSGGTSQFGVYTEGTTPSYFGGKVGIGTTAPTGKLEVIGSTDTQQLIVKANATQTSNLSEWRDSAGVVISGVDSRGIMFSTGGKSTQNHFAGYAAGSVTGTGQGNLGIGPYSLNSFTTGGGNVAVGQSTLNSITTGLQNVAIGWGALVSAITNTQSNTAIGYGAMGQTFGNPIGNTSVGHNSMRYVTGTNNVSLGLRSAAALTSGSQNIFIGPYAGSLQTTVSNAFIVDSQAASRASAAEEVTNSLLYGIMAAAPANQTLRINAKINADASTVPLTVLGASSQTANLQEWQNNSSLALSFISPTGGAYFAGNVGIGTTAPGSILDVKGTLRLSGSSSGYVGLAPAAAAGSITYTLPSADGTDGQFLKTNGSATLSWASAGAGSLPSGTLGQTLRNDGASWLASSLLINSGSLIGIGKTPINTLLDMTTALTGGLTGVKLVVNGFTTGDLMSLSDTGITSGRGIFLDITSTDTNATTAPTGLQLNMTDTGIIASGNDSILGQGITITKTGATTAGIISSTGQSISVTSTGGTGNVIIGQDIAVAGSKTITGQKIVASNTDGSAATAVTGTYSYVYANVADSTITNAIAGQFLVSSSYNDLVPSAGVITNAYAGKFQILSGAGGTTNAYALYVDSSGDYSTNNYGLYVSSPNAGNTNNYGLYVADQTGYNLYSLGTTSKNYIDGNIGIGSTVFGTSSSRVLAIANSIAPTTSITNGVQLYAVDVAGSHELRVRDEAGNVTTLSPHNFSLIEDGPSEELAWSYYSEKDGLAINVDMTKALRIIEEMSGKKLIFEKDVANNLEINSFVATESAIITRSEFGLLEEIVNKIKLLVDDLVRQIAEMSQSFRTIESHQEKLCVGTSDKETCVTQDQLDTLIKLLPSPTASASALPSPSIEPFATPVPDSTESATISSPLL